MDIKQKVKDYLDGNSYISDKLKENMVNKDDWGEFKRSITSAVTQYANNPTAESKKKINSVISNYFLENSYEASRIIENMMTELGITGRATNNDKKGTQNRSRSNNSREKAATRKLYDELGLSYDFSKEEIGERYEALFGKNLEKVEKKAKKGKEVRGTRSTKQKAAEKVKCVNEKKLATVIKGGAKLTAGILARAGDLLLFGKDIDLENDERDNSENSRDNDGQELDID